MVKAEIIRRVEFYDIDMMNVMWHGNYVKFFESARTELFESIKFNYLKMKDEGFALPIIKFNIKFIKPAFLGDELRVVALVKDCDSILKIDYYIYKFQELITKGQSSQVAIDFRTNKVIPQIPKGLAEAILGNNL